MEEAILPFLEYADEISIVLGGKSEDNTEKIARKYTDKVIEYPGNFMYGPARQLAYEQLSTDWIVTVDMDEIWNGVPNIPIELDNAVDNVTAILVRISILDYLWTQTRIHRRGFGKWVGGVHEHWETTGNTIYSNGILIKQAPKDEDGKKIERYIELGYSWLKDNPNDLRALSHLVKDLASAKRIDEVKEMSYKYYAKFDNLPPEQQKINQMYNVLINHAAIEVDDGGPEALNLVITSLGYANHGAAWILLAEYFQRKAQTVRNKKALAELAIFCADQAIKAGKTRSGVGYTKTMSAVFPFQIKAYAYEMLEMPREAVQALDLAIWLEPTNQALIKYRDTLCRMIGIIP